MNSTRAAVDLDDVDGLLASDRTGLLRAASMAGAQVRATAAALEEGELESLRSGAPPRTLIWVAGRGTAASAGAMLAAALGAVLAAPMVVVPEVPPWIGPLDVLVVAGDDAGDSALVTAAGTGVRRGARVAVVAPYAGPLRDVAAGRSAVLAPRLPAPDEFGLTRYLAAGLAIGNVVDPGVQTDLAVLADELDAEALRNSAGRELFTNPAKALADRLSGRDVVLAGDNAATLALARHGAAVLLRIGHQTAAAVELTDVLVALHAGMGAGPDDEQSLFHDEQIDGPLPQRLRTVVLTTDAERPAILARVSGVDGVDVLNADDVPDASPLVNVRPEQQLAMMAVRLEMTAVYLRLVRG